MIRIIKHDSAEYRQMVHLRKEALLKPIGVPETYIIEEAEVADILIGAFEEGEITGCCVLTPKDKRTAQLRQMAVRPDLQGKRIGAAIIRFAEMIARENGFSTLMMHARNPVIPFYEKCGYSIAGSEFFEVGMGHHRMEKQLS